MSISGKEKDDGDDESNDDEEDVEDDDGEKHTDTVLHSFGCCGLFQLGNRLDFLLAKANKIVLIPAK